MSTSIKLDAMHVKLKHQLFQVENVFSSKFQNFFLGITMLFRVLFHTQRQIKNTKPE